MELEKTLTLILPTLNEELNIVPQIQKVLDVLPSIYQIFVVDDNSTDKTIENIRKAFPKQIETRQIKYLVRKENLGLTPSLEESVRRADSLFVGWMDCDLSMPPEKLKEMLVKIEQGFDVCVGSRFLPGGEQKDFSNLQKDSRIAIMASSHLNFLFKQFKKFPVTDLTSGFIIARRDLLVPLKWEGRHGEYFMSLMVQLNNKGAKITEIPYTCGTRQFGESKTFGSLKAKVLNPIRYTKAMLKVLISR